MQIRHIFSVLLVFLTLLVTSCCSESGSDDSAGGPPVIVTGPQNPETNYTVIADEHLSEEYKTAILLALNEWAEKTNNIFTYKLSFVDMTNQPADFSASHTIKIYVKDPGPGLAGWATWSVSNRSAYILVGGGVPSDYFRRVMLHELGHTLDLHFGTDTHYQGPNASIMWPGMGDAAAHLCCPELTAFCNNYGCKIECTDVAKGEALHTTEVVWAEYSMP
jgi:hypothetical protein